MSKNILPPTGKKVSVFKRERNAKNESEGNLPSPSPFHGGVVERSMTSTSVVRDVICSTSGFPSTKVDSALRLGVVKQHTSGDNTPNLMKDELPPKQFESSAENRELRDIEASNFEADNLQKVLAMSSDEYAQSMQELASLFPESTLDFLRQRGEQRLATGAHPTTTKLKSVPHTSTAIHSSPLLSPAASASAAAVGGEHHNHSPLVDRQAAVVPGGDYIARDEGELRARIRHAPETVQRALAWTLCDDDVDGNGLANAEDNPAKPGADYSSKHPLSQEARKPPVAPVSKPAPRFDLQGARIVVYDGVKLTASLVMARSMTVYVHQWQELLAHSFLGRLLPLESLPTADAPASTSAAPNALCSSISALADVCARSMVSTGFVVVIACDGEEGHGGGQVAPELEHHEFEQGSPGYSLLEVCEFLRSEVPSQRAMGHRIMSGVLWRRDVASSMEAYAAYNISPESMTSDDPCMNVIEYKGTAAGKETQYDSFCRAYSSLLDLMVRSVLATVRPAKGENGGRSNDIGLSPKDMQLLIRDVRRLLSYAILKTCCTPDFPPQIASVITSNAVVSSQSCYSKGPTLSTSTNTMQELRALKTLLCFVGSKQELLAGDLLWGVSGGWGGVQGRVAASSPGPPLPMPHARRTEVTYPRHIQDCVRNTGKVMEDIIHNIALAATPAGDMSSSAEPYKGWAGAAKTPHEEFALQCRWARGEALFTAGVWGLSRALGGSIAGALEHIQRMDDGADITVSLEIGAMAANILTAALRTAPNACTPTAISPESVASVVFKDAVQPIWPLIISGCDRSEVSVSPFLQTVWRLLAEVSRCGRDYCVWMCDGGLLDVGMAVLGKCIAADARAIMGRDECTQRDTWHLDATSSLPASDAARSSSRSSPAMQSQRGIEWVLRWFRCASAYFIHTDSLVNMLSTVSLLSKLRVDEHFIEPAAPTPVSSVNDDRSAMFVSWVYDKFGLLGGDEFFVFLEETALSCALDIRTRQELSLTNSRSSAPVDGRNCEVLCQALLDVAISVVQFIQAANIIQDSGASEQRESCISPACLHFVASVIGSTGISCQQDCSSTDPLEDILSGCHLRGYGLCVELEQTLILACPSCVSSVTEDMFTSRLLQLRTLAVSILRWTTFAVCKDNEKNLLVDLSSREACEQWEWRVASKRLLLCVFSQLASDTFAATAAEVLSASGAAEGIVKVIAYDEQCPTLMPSPVAAGLFSHKTRMLSQNEVLINLQLKCVMHLARRKCGIAFSSSQDLLEQVSEVVSVLAECFPGTARLLLETIVRHYLTGGVTLSIHPENRSLSFTSLTADEPGRSDDKMIHTLLNSITAPSKSDDGLVEAISVSSYATHHLSGYSHLDNAMDNMHATEHSSNSHSLYRMSFLRTRSLYMDCSLLNTDLSASAVTPLWMYDCLRSLRGRYLRRWMQVLASHDAHSLWSLDRPANDIQTEKSENCITGGHDEMSQLQQKQHILSVAACGDSNRPDWGGVSPGVLMFWLCRLTVSEVVYHPPMAEEMAEDDGDPLFYCAAEYTTLMMRAIARLYEDYLRSGSTSGRQQPLHYQQCAYSAAWNDFNELAGSCVNTSSAFASATASGGDDAPTGLMPGSRAQHLRVWEKSVLHIVSDGQTYISPSVHDSSDGVNDVVGRLIDAACSQTCADELVHAASLTPLLVPGLFPVAVAKRLWTDIGGPQLRLLHLAEHKELLEHVLPAFLPCAQRGASVLLPHAEEYILSILDALLQMRNYALDRHMMVAQIGIYTISRFLFQDVLMSPVSGGGSGVDSDGIIMGGSARLLRNLIRKVCEGRKGSGWNWRSTLLGDVLRFYQVLEETECILLEGFDARQKGSSLMKCQSERILSLWQSSMPQQRGEDNRDSEKDAELLNALQLRVNLSSMTSRADRSKNSDEPTAMLKRVSEIISTSLHQNIG